MKILSRGAVAGIICAAIALAATTPAPKYLTVGRVIALADAGNVPHAEAYKVDVSGLGSATLPASKPEGRIEMGWEVIFATHFEPPHAGDNVQPVPVIPSTPTDFGKINVGWTIHLSAKPYGKLVELSGAADFVEAELLPAGYGAVAGPIYTDCGDAVLTPNKIEQPRVRTTTTHFNLFALPGETYEVTLYRGAKAEKHKVTVHTE